MLPNNKDAKKYNAEALNIYKSLIRKYPQVYGLDYAKTIWVGAHYLNIKHPKKMLKEAKEILQKYYKGVPEAEKFIKKIKEIMD